MNEKVCDYCHQPAVVQFYAYGKHSCANPICRSQHEADGVCYFQSIGRLFGVPQKVQKRPSVIPPQKVFPKPDLDGTAGTPTKERDTPFVPP